MITCLKCNSNSLVIYSEEVLGFEQKILNNKIQEEKTIKFKDKRNFLSVKCTSCNQAFRYNVDWDGVITNIHY